MKSLLAILAIAIGVAAIVLGGIDDAPGPQLLGVLLVVGVGSTWWLFRRTARRQPPADAGPRD
jgi:predicted exporter